MKFFHMDDDNPANGITYQLPWVYAHCEAERVNGRVAKSYRRKFDGDGWGAPDLVCCDVHEDGIKDGVHDCTLYGQPCKLFMWTEEKLSSGWTFGVNGTESWRKHIRRGLVCLTTDTQACDYARSKMQERSRFL